MNIRLNAIIKTCHNKNSRKGFIKYIASLYALFAEANFPFILEFNKNLKEKNIKRERILKEIDDIKRIINTVFSSELIITFPPSQKEKIEILMLVCNSIYAEDELKRLMEELNKTK